MIIYISKGCENSTVAQNICCAYPAAKRFMIEDSEADRRHLYEKEQGSEKHHIFITKARGRHFKVCPGTEKPYICCYYWTLHAATNCPFDCSYCILQYYLNNPLLTVFSNTEELIEMMQKRMAIEPERLFRVGTGELADSLALDPVTKTAEQLIRFAAEQNNMLLELKTKSAAIDHLLHVPHHGKTVMAWSLNPVKCIAAHEHKTAGLEARLSAAKKAQDAGYLLAFHFDPMLYYPDWENGYASLVRSLFESVDPGRIAWISMGSLRFPPEMAEKIRKKFPDTDLLNTEMIRGADQKSRYFKPLRIKMYKHLYRQLREYGGESLFIYFCMEDAVVWERVMGFTPGSNEHLDYLFAKHLTKKFPELNFPEADLEQYRGFESRRSWERDGSQEPVVGSR